MAKYNNLTLGQIEAIVNKLGGEKEAMRFLAGTYDPKVVRVGELPVYLECEVGGKSAAELLQELGAADMYITSVARTILESCNLQSEERKVVKFGKATLRELGFTQLPSTEQIIGRILEIGYALCLPGDAPALRLALQGNEDFRFSLVMETIRYQRVGDPLRLSIKTHTEGRYKWLNTAGEGDDIRTERSGNGIRYLDTYAAGLDHEVVFRLHK
ncbi:MAG: hypothetical protein CEO12_537 [Parcubacteria group bacterium Gr01-1014_46]|nr:MAG: hypothetical protein CEO12_537 [Parcubacteria group bacterium Gr01-1014_46]